MRTRVLMGNRDRRPLLDPAFRSLIHEMPPNSEITSFPERQSGGRDGRIRVDDRRHRPRLRHGGLGDGEQYLDNPGNADEQLVGSCAFESPSGRVCSRRVGRRYRPIAFSGVAARPSRPAATVLPSALPFRGPPVPEFENHLENLGPRWKRPAVFSLVTFDRPKELELLDCVLALARRRVHMATPSARHAGSVGAQRLLARSTINPLPNRLALRSQPFDTCDVAGRLEPGSHRVSPPEAARPRSERAPPKRGTGPAIRRGFEFIPGKGRDAIVNGGSIEEAS